ncbi:MAG: glycosyltransferase family 2 protein, partial [Ilumatobacteraceae bacterium]|nr:glycosyltransferase family 2 protein [Ilumatobacteraceae bacterium]
MTEPQVVSSLPPVVAVMVVHERGEWLAESLQGLAGQNYNALQSLVLVTGAEDDPISREILDVVATNLPSAVVRFLGGNPGFGAACNSVLNLVDGNSGLFCFLHDDVALAPDAISCLVEELYRSNAGAVGPKLVYWDDPRMIQSVGIAVDRFGNSLPIADDGELDQEQHDAVQDVFVVSSACIMVRADLFATINGYNPELPVAGVDLDFCWRLHSTAARVMVVPSAVGRHRENSSQSVNNAGDVDHFLENEIVRVRTVASLTSATQLLATLVQMFALTLSRFFILAATGRVRRAVDEMRALLLLPFGVVGIRERRDAISEHRQVSGDEVRALQLPGNAYIANFLRRRAAQAGQVQSQSAGQSHEATPRSAYWLWGILATIFLVGSRALFMNGVVPVGQMAPITASASELARSYTSGWWGAGFGQVSAVPTGIAILATSALTTLGNMELLHTLLVALLPLAGWLGVWRFASVLGTRAARIAATAAYAAVPLPYAAISSGRWGALLMYATLPWMVHLLRMLVGHADLEEELSEELMAVAPTALWRKWFACLLLLVGTVIAFEPSVVLVVPLVAIIFTLVSVVHGTQVRWAIRWVVVTAAVIVSGVVLNLPWAGTYIRSGWWEAITGAPVESGRNIGLIGLATFNVGGFVLSSVTVTLYAVVIGAVLLVHGVRSGWVLRGASLVAFGLAVAMLDDSALLPVHLPEPAILLVPVAFGIAICAGAMGAALVVDLRRARFGWRQPISAIVALAFAVGLVPVSVNALNGSWSQPSLALPQLLAQLPDAQSSGEYRTMFIGDTRVLPGASLNFGWGISYSVVNSGAPTLEELWETPPTRARDNAVAALYGIVRGQTARAGRLLAPLSVRFIVVPIVDGGQSTRSDPIAAPRGLIDSLSRQLDLRRLYASPDLVIFENASWVPVRSMLTASGAASSQLAGATSMIATDISG